MARPAATPQIDHARPSQQTARYSDLTILDDVAAQRVRTLPYRGARAATPGATPSPAGSLHDQESGWPSRIRTSVRGSKVIGEILAIRQLVGHRRLPEYVGDIEAKAPYRPEWR